jgi:hypothetical protein
MLPHRVDAFREEPFSIILFAKKVFALAIPKFLHLSKPVVSQQRLFGMSFAVEQYSHYAIEEDFLCYKLGDCF